MKNKTLSKSALQNRIEQADIVGLEHRKQFVFAMLGLIAFTYVSVDYHNSK